MPSDLTFDDPHDVNVDPSLVPKAILDEHSRREERGKGPGMQTFLSCYGAIASDRRRPNDDGAWQVLLANGLTNALLTCALDGHFCGFSKVELNLWAYDPDSLEYLTHVLVSGSRKQGLAIMLTALWIVLC